MNSYEKADGHGHHPIGVSVCPLSVVGGVIVSDKRWFPPGTSHAGTRAPEISLMSADFFTFHHKR